MPDQVADNPELRALWDTEQNDQVAGPQPR
jgi:hypothetical protein